MKPLPRGILSKMGVRLGFSKVFFFCGCEGMEIHFFERTLLQRHSPAIKLSIEMLGNLTNDGSQQESPESQFVRLGFRN